MKKTTFQVPLYGVDITLVQAECKDDALALKKEMKRLCCDQESMDTTFNNIEQGCMNGGDTYRNFAIRKMLVIFYPMSSEDVQAEVYCHEKRHVEDRIMEWACVNDIESAGLLAVFLGTKFYEFWNKVTNKQDEANRI